MGPRRVSRGNPETVSRYLKQRKELQWGHGVLAVEMTEEQAFYNDGSLLQWGHGVLAVEMGHCLRTCQRKSMLQWGHGVLAVEIR